MNHRTSQILTIVGFFLFFSGMMALVLSLVDVRLTIINWITEWLGRGGAFVVHLMMIVLGIVFVVASRTNFAGEDPRPKTNATIQDETAEV